MARGCNYSIHFLNFASMNRFIKPTIKASDSMGDDIIVKYFPLFYNNYFIFIRITLLFCAAGKMISVLSNSPLLSRNDPLFEFFTLRHVFFIAVLLECAVAYFLWTVKTVCDRAILVLWLSGLFLSYRLGLLLIGYTGPCQCLGYWSDNIGLSHKTVSWLLTALLSFMTFGSIFTYYMNTLYSKRISIMNDINS